jgi:fatty acid amide hydrolase 2
VRPARVEALRHSLEIWSAMLSASSADGPSFSAMLGCGQPIRAGRELFRWAIGRSPHTLPAIGLALLEKLPALLNSKSAQMVELGRALRREVVEMIGPRGVLLYPPYPTPAPRHVRPLFTPYQWVYTAVWNVLEMPATQVPLGLNRAGLPLGVQVVGTHGSDHVTIAVARELERAFGGWVPPPIARPR